MLIYIVVTYDTTSFSEDERVEIEKVFSTKEKAKRYAKDLSLNSCQNYNILEYTLDEED